MGVQKGQDKDDTGLPMQWKHGTERATKNSSAKARKNGMSKAKGTWEEWCSVDI